MALMETIRSQTLVYSTSKIIPHMRPVGVRNEIIITVMEVRGVALDHHNECMYRIDTRH